MSEHPLDRPVWNALRSRQSGLSVGGERARRFVADVSPLAGARDDDPRSLAELGELAPAGHALILLQVGPSATPPGMLVERTAEGVQMVAEAWSHPIPEAPVGPLGDADAAEMLALATLTEPGPFLPRTHTLGGFWGLRREGRLAAMAGERLRLDGLTELSGVCTHPDFRGRGYARLLSQVVAARIAARGETPFLHAYAVNQAAIGLYRSLGFTVRTATVVTVLRRA